MDTQCAAATNPGYTMNLSSGALGSGNGDGVMSEEEEQEEEDGEEKPSRNERTPVGSISTLAQHSPPAVTAQTQSSALAHWTSNTEGETEGTRRCEAASDGYVSKCLKGTQQILTFLPSEDL